MTKTRHHPGIASALAALTLSAAVGGCTTRESTLMRHPQTGEELFCYTREYYVESSSKDIAFSEACIHACERYGFQPVRSHSVYTPKPADPPAEFLVAVPARCLP